MVTVYQLIFFLSIGLIAIVVTLFVLAVSLLGRAIALSTKEQIQAEEKRKEDTKNEIQRIQGKLDQVKHSGQLNVEDLYRDLKNLNSNITKHNWKLRWIRIKPKLLTANWGVLVPGAFLLTSVIVTILALYRGGTSPATTPYMWISITTLGIGICFVCLTLKVVEGVAKTSEETAFQRETEILKTSLREFEAERKPIVTISFKNMQFPLKMAANSERSFEFVVEVFNSTVRNGVIFLAAPEGFQFGDCESAAPSLEKGTNRPIAARIDLPNIIVPGTYRLASFTLKTPSTLGKYSLTYDLIHQDARTGRMEYEVEVVAED